MDKESLLARAIQIASNAHCRQFDKAGEAYILHALAVMDKVAPDRTAMIVAVLHDVLEDQPEYWAQYDSSGLPPEILSALDCLTKRKGEKYFDYIDRVASHPTARKVKLADLEHNMDTGRLPEDDITETDYQRWDKYRRATIRLKRH